MANTEARPKYKRLFVLLFIVLILAGLSLLGWPAQVLGHTVAEPLRGGAESIVGYALVAYAFLFMVLRKQQFKSKIFLESALLITAIFLIIFGLRLTSIGIGPGHLIQDDGYSVTGGFIAAIGGTLLGIWLNDKYRISNGKR